MKAIVKREWLLWLILLAPFVYAAFIWNALPDRMPTHWGINGKVDGYGSKGFGALFPPFFNVGLYLLFLALPWIDPRKKNYAEFAPTFKTIRLGLALFITIFYYFAIQAALGNDMFISKGMEILILFLFAFLGNYLRTVRPNWFIGIRTPWTMDSPEVWRRTHQMGGKLFFYTGLAGIPLVLLLDNEFAWLAFALIITSAIVAVVYSFVIFKTMEKQ